MKSTLLQDKMRSTPMQEKTVKDLEQQDPCEAKGTQSQEGNEQYPPLRVVIPVLLSAYLAVFLTSLDRTIIGVAIPAISNEFKSFDDISWYESAFLLTLCVFQLPMGKIFKFFSAKWSFVTVVVIFEVGCVICAAAPNSRTLIAGRAVAGVGGAGTLVGTQVVIRDLVPLQKRPQYQGFVGAVFGIASILGPLLGGVFTTHLTWRWCFWISLPIGGLALVGLVLLLPATAPTSELHGSFLEMAKRFDPLGNSLFAPGVICFLLALQWGGVKYAWSSAQVIALLVVGVVLLLAFVAVQFWVQENGTIPPRIISQRSIASGAVVALAIGAPLIITSFYLPIWFQAIQGDSANHSGIKILPYFLSTVFSVIGCGIAVSKLGYYTPWLTAGCAILMIGSGLFTTLAPDTTTGQWIGYQILIGVGIGLSLPQTSTAAQTVLHKDDIPTGISILALAQNLGGTVFVSVAQTVLSNTLRSKLASALPGFDTSAISTAGATGIRDLVAKDDLQTVLVAYNAGIAHIFYCALGASCLALVASFFLEWKTVKPQEEKTSQDSEETP